MGASGDPERELHPGSRPWRVRTSSGERFAGTSLVNPPLAIRLLSQHPNPLPRWPRRPDQHSCRERAEATPARPGWMELEGESPSSSFPARPEPALPPSGVCEENLTAKRPRLTAAATCPIVSRAGAGAEIKVRAAAVFSSYPVTLAWEVRAGKEAGPFSWGRNIGCI